MLFDSRGLGGNDMEARGLEGLGTFESWGFGPEVDLIAFVDVGGFLQFLHHPDDMTQIESHKERRRWQKAE